MSATGSEVLSELLHSRTGIAGISILAILVIISIATVSLMPSETLKDWNNPGGWLQYPKSAMPAWTNLFQPENLPEHQIVRPAGTSRHESAGISIVTAQYPVEFAYDGHPGGFIYEYGAEYTGSPLLEIAVVRPDGVTLDIFSGALPRAEETAVYAERIFSSDESISDNIMLQRDIYSYDISGITASDAVFSGTGSHEVLKGRYTFVARIYSDGDISMTDSAMIVGGRVFGVMGTDELRRDLAVGLLWGTPLALFIGVAVATGSVVMGLLYGIYAGYRGRYTDEAMMRFNDIIYALPALPFLIILAVTISNSIFLMIGFLMIFGWVGVAKVARSMSLQIKTRGYVDASRTMGQKDSRIILRHILPQLLPYAFASIAISVPAAITTEAGLSFLGLGDPTYPTWGQILHDANTFGAAARGLWWWIMPPGVMIAITGLAFVFIGNALDVIANPRLRRR